jgi:hypothetical protein
MALTYNICQRLLPPFESAPNALEIEEGVIQDPSIDIHPDLNPSAETVRKPEVQVTDIQVPLITEGRGGRKRCGKHPSTIV